MKKSVVMDNLFLEIPYVFFLYKPNLKCTNIKNCKVIIIGSIYNWHTTFKLL